ncbi:MAG: universal stress protein [Aigarchaeota archaeon]|nr:universal stress protein [Candidatus Pelearchaeum maunauluense]
MSFSSFKKILVPVDGSEFSGKAVRVAVELAKRYDGSITLLHVISAPSSYLVAVPAAGATVEFVEEYYAQAKKRAEEWMGKYVAELESLGVKASSVVLEGASSVVEAITNYAENEKFDLIIIGTRGLSGFKRLLVGSVASGVVSHARCSVLVVK